MMLARGNAKKRGHCPTCRIPVYLSADELETDLTCNVCGSSFQVRKRRRRRYVAGRWNIPTLQIASEESVANRPRPTWVGWVAAILLFVLLALTFLLLADSPQDGEQIWFPARIWRLLAGLMA